MKEIEAEIRKNFGNAVKSYRELSPCKISQRKLTEDIIELSKNSKFRQEVISQIELGKDIGVYIKDILVIQKICNIPDSIVEPYIHLMTIRHPARINGDLVNIKENEYLLTKCKRHTEFNFYKGKYFCYFYSTNDKDPKIVKGIMNITLDQISNKCKANFIIFDNNIPIKHYNGQFFINSNYNATYCILISEDKQETSFLISNHYPASYKKNNLFNLALALTSSAGKPKIPTVHRMIISRVELTDQTISLLKSQLKLNNDDVFISKGKLQEMEEKFKKERLSTKDKSYKALCDSILHIIDYIKNNGTQEMYYTIKESTIYDELIDDESKGIQSMVLANLRNYTDKDYNNKISDRTSDICVKIIEGQQN